MVGTWSERVLDLLPAALFGCCVAAAVHLYLILVRNSQNAANNASRPSVHAPKTPRLTSTPSSQPPEQAACSSTRIVEHVLNDSATSLARSSSKPMASAQFGDGVATLLEESPYPPSTAGPATVATQPRTCTPTLSALSSQQQISSDKAASASGRASLAQVSSPAATKAARLAATEANFNMVLQRLGSAPALPLTPTQSGRPSAELHAISDVTGPKVPALGQSAATQPQAGTASNRHVKASPGTTPPTDAAAAALLATGAGEAGDVALARDSAKPPAASIDLGSIQRQLQSRGTGVTAPTAAGASTPLAMQQPAGASMGPGAAAAAAAFPAAPAVRPATAPAPRVQLSQAATHPAGPAVRPVRPSALYTSPMQHITVSIKVPLPFEASAAHALQDCVSQHVISSAAAQQPPQHTIMHMVAVPGCIQLLMSVVQWREGQQPEGQAVATAATTAANPAMQHAQHQQQPVSVTPQRQPGMLGLASFGTAEAAGAITSTAQAEMVSATSPADAGMKQQQIAAHPYTPITAGDSVVSSTRVSGPGQAVATPAPDWMVHAICRGVEQFMRMHAEGAVLRPANAPTSSRHAQGSESNAAAAAHATAGSSSFHATAADTCASNSSAVPCEPYSMLGAPGPVFGAHQLLHSSWPGTSALIDINGRCYQLQPDPFDDAAPWGLKLVEEEQAQQMLADMRHHNMDAADIVTGQSGSTAPMLAAAAAAAPASAGGSVLGTLYESSAALHGSSEMRAHVDASLSTAFLAAEEHGGNLMLSTVQEPSQVVLPAAAAAGLSAGPSASVLPPTERPAQLAASPAHAALSPQLAAIDEQLAMPLSHASDVQQQQEQPVPASCDTTIPEAASQDVRQPEPQDAAPLAAVECNETATTQHGAATDGAAPTPATNATIAAAPPMLALQPAVPPGVWVWPLYLPTTPTSSSSTACTSWMPVPVPLRPRPAAATGLPAVAAPQQLPPVVAVHGLPGASCHFVVATTPGDVLADCPCIVQHGIARMQPEPCSAVAKRTLYCLTPSRPAAGGAAAVGGSSSSGSSSTRPPSSSSSTGEWQAHPGMDPAADKVLFALPVLYVPPAVVHELNESARAVLREQAHRQLIEQQEHAAALGSGPDYIYMYASEMASETCSPGSGEAEDGLGSEGSSSRHLGSFDTVQLGAARATSSFERSSTSRSSSSSSSVRSSSSNFARRQSGSTTAADFLGRQCQEQQQQQQQQQRTAPGQQALAAGPTAAAAAGGGGGGAAGGSPGADWPGSGGSTFDDDDDQHMINLRGRLFAGTDVQNLYLALLADVGLLIDLATTADSARIAAAAGNEQVHSSRDGNAQHLDNSVHGGSSSTSSTTGSTIAYVYSASSEASKHMAASVGQQLLSWGASESAWNFCQLVLTLLDAIGVLLQRHGQPLLREHFATAAAVQQMLLGQTAAGAANPAVRTAATDANGSNAVAPSNASQLRTFNPSGILRPPSTAAAAAAVPADVAEPPTAPLATAAAALQSPHTSASAAPTLQSVTAGASASARSGDNRPAAVDSAWPAALQRAPTPSPHQLQLQLQIQSQGVLSETASLPSQPLDWWDSARSAAAAAAAAAPRQPSVHSSTGGAAAATQATVITSTSVGGTAAMPGAGDGTSSVHASQEGTSGATTAATKDWTAGVGAVVANAPPNAQFSNESSAHTAGSSSVIQSAIALSSGASSDVPVVQQQQRLASAKSLSEHGRRFRLSLKDSASDMFSRLLRRQDKGQKPAP